MNTKFVIQSVVASVGLTMAFAGTQAAAQSDWEFNITPYAWMSGLSGDLGTVPGLPSQPVDLSFGDIFDDLDYGLFLLSSARNGPWVIYFDGSLVKTTSDEQIGGPIVQALQVESKTTNAALSLGRTVSVSQDHNIDVYLGVRYWKIENNFAVNTVGPLLRSSSSADWVDPIIGVAGRYRINDRWVLFGSADIGGFGVGSDMQWSVQTGANYSFTDRVSLSVGWRYMSVDYQDNGIVFDVSQSGPLIGATFKF
ncbi:hypothetical protein [Ruegeria marina]|uniref:Outer membrane protein beta-barrel domain-containing protein n=1 Tax=Ruegeria marina TaxID=639004 RepID=A0A1G7F7M6_9RHOB|nr:hypothetical protein [Ruegeria marina]SDE71871.1 hypothetical protein SAMN04488239_13023 [Ruegeria marina]